MSGTQNRNKSLADDGGRLGREVLGLASIFLGLLVILSLATFDGRDPWLNHVVSTTVLVRNKAGLFGAYLAGLLYDIVGAGSWAVPAFFCLAGIRRILGGASWPWWRWTGFILFSLSLCLAGAAVDLGHVDLLSRGSLPAGSGNTSSHGGGIVGHVIYTGLVGWMGPVGAFLVWFFSLALALQMLTGISLPRVLMDLGLGAREFVRSRLEKMQGRAPRPDRAAPPRSGRDERPLPLIRNKEPGLELAPDLPLPEMAKASMTEAPMVEAPWSEPDAAAEKALWAATGTAAQSAVQAVTDAGLAEDENFWPEESATRSDVPGYAPPASDLPGHAPTGYAEHEDPAPALAPPSAKPPERYDELVHPMVPRSRPDILPPEFFGSVEEKPEQLSLPDEGAEEELPPWVRDFEMDRIGVAQGPEPSPPVSAAPGAPLFPELAPLQAAPAAGLVPASPMQAVQTAQATELLTASPMQTAQAAQATASAPVARHVPESVPGPALHAAEQAQSAALADADEDLFTAVWGEAKAVENSSPASTVAGPAMEESGGRPTPLEEIRPHVSPRTAVAVEALRSAATLEQRPEAQILARDQGDVGSPVQDHDGISRFGLDHDGISRPALDHDGADRQAPELSDSALSRSLTELPNRPEHSVPAQVPPGDPGLMDAAPLTPASSLAVPASSLPDPAPSEALVAGPDWAAAAYEDDVPIFETPTIVEQAGSPGMVERLAKALVRPRVIPLPSLDLLQSSAVGGGGAPRELLEEKGRSLMTCLKDFGVQGELVGITPGPVVTMFEVRPAPGVRVSRISNLSDDLALALKAVAVRIQAPVPGTDTVGIEIPNEKRETVCLKELLGSRAFADSKSLLTLALGKDIAGNPAVADLATMPHLLVAGATGAGKSVGINSIILSLLYKARPEELQLLLVDPKRVEMAIYADLPHLVHPVVTEMQLAKNALEWAVAEMERRYDCIARAGVRNIADYNAKIASFGDNAPENMADLEFMPYLVLIIDELADLMLVAAKEVENSIVRLAQLARAAGIHLILATQRPSVDVVTGLIKANFPCRISFQVTSKHDSRTILDTVGAEHLLGKGDMLFKPAGGKSIRLHGAFVRDRDVNDVVGYWKSQQPPRYRVDFSDWAPEAGGSGILSSGGGGSGRVSDDPLYNEAVDFVRQQGKASISLIQRKFRIGFNKAARYIEQMEVDGIIGPADGSKPRTVIG